MDPSYPSTSTPPSPPPPPPPPPLDYNQYPPEPLTERALRALEHRLRLVHRSNSDFFILGATGNVYTVNLSPTPSCTCPDRTTPCKHILFVYIRVLSVSLDDPCIWRRTLQPCQLTRLLMSPISLDTLVGVTIRQRFQEMYVQRATTHPDGKAPPVQAEEGSTCPVCLDEMGSSSEARKLVACATCKNPIHEECLLAWKRSSRRRSTSCVICRSRWRDRAELERYINLSAYLSHDEENNNTVNLHDQDGEDYCDDALVN
uniref:mitogen-activated protein kinase kinase kinase 1-like n=1 Tax=Erigeron canadensis TaxID=72917 RepID=UPI001CB9950C|nr:mitogen-activated protein kinase kinase kinase 1-like [Erigeron canadensis]